MTRRRQGSSSPSQVACSPAMEAMVGVRVHPADLVERSKDLIAFSILVLGSLV